MKMKKKDKHKDVSNEMFMLLAEDAKSINTYGLAGMAGQPIFMDRLSHTHSKENENRLVEELTK